MRHRGPISMLLAVALLAVAITAPASAHVPARFVGIGIDGPFFYPQFDQNGQLNLMQADGIRSLRTLFNWGQLQPYSSFSAIPPSQRPPYRVYQSVGGVPTDFSGPDAFVALAAAHGMTVLPVVEYAPAWDALKPGDSGSPPRSDAPYGRLLTALVDRYGPHGSFWTQHPGLPKLPIRSWQIWNEPNFTAYWDKQPFQRSYVALLRVAHRAIKGADHGAKVVLAGLTNFSWRYLDGMYRIRGARNLFDVVAAHPYTAQPQGVITILGKVRAVMRRHGDRRKPLIATEISWPSAAGKAKTHFENSTTEAGQAKKLSRAVSLLARDRRRLGLEAFYYYTWIGNETLPGAQVDPFNFAGLERFINGQGVFAKPALGAFARAVNAIEH